MLQTYPTKPHADHQCIEKMEKCTYIFALGDPKVRLALEIMVLNFCSVVLLLYELHAAEAPAEKLKSLSKSKSVPAFYGNPKIIPFLKRSRNWSLSRERRIHSTPCCPLGNGLRWYNIHNHFRKNLSSGSKVKSRTGTESIVDT